MHMKTSPFFSSRTSGFALLTVLLFILVVVVLTASMLRYSVSERRLNERNRLVLRARNMAENISVYAAEQLTTKLYRLRSAQPMAFMTGSNEIDLPPDNVLTTQFTSPTGMEVRAGLTETSGLVYVDPSVASNAGNPNVGLSVSTSIVPIISKSTATHPALGSVVAYSQHDIEVSMIPLFQFGIFYNMDLELFPGQPMVIGGPVHTNGRLMARGEIGSSSTTTITFANRVTAAAGLYANGQMKVAYRRRNGTTAAGAGGTGAVSFANTAGTTFTNLQASSTGTPWRDHMWGGSTETTTTLNQFKTFATSTYTGNLRTNVHGVTKLELPSIGTYREVNDPSTPEDDRNNGRQIIEPPVLADSAGVRESKISRKAGLYIVVNPDATNRTALLPNDTTVVIRGYAYRCFLNTLETDGTHTISEVVLPGQPSYGWNAGTSSMYTNALPNRYTASTSIGSNQVLRIPQSPIDTAGTGYDRGAGVPAGTPPPAAFPDAYFYDNRRAINNSGYPYNRPVNRYTPRPIAKIDFDLVRFKMTVERTLLAATTSTLFDPSQPGAGNWARSIFNAAGVPAALGLGLGGSFNTFTTAADPYALYYATLPADPAVAVTNVSLVNTTNPCPWFDGITIYLHSVGAEIRDGTRVASGVRLWHGRGPVISLNGTTYPNKTGFTFVTNDAAYVVGHFNADGKNLVSDVTLNTFSGRYPDAGGNERLACVMSDAITILSQPTFTNAAYRQTAGWCDALSAHTVNSSSGYITLWYSSNLGSSNSYDGIGTLKRPGAMPNLSTAAGVGTEYDEKLPTVDTEVSTALLMGIVPSNHNPAGLTDGPPSLGANQQYSGGAHNFPRMLESWNGNDLYIRGSMVALFESRVAMEPWNLRVYTAPNRYWGLHENLRNPNHDVPLEPIVLNAQRMRYRELTPAQYAAQKIVLEALPH